MLVRNDWSATFLDAEGAPWGGPEHIIVIFGDGAVTPGWVVNVWQGKRPEGPLELIMRFLLNGDGWRLLLILYIVII